MRYALIVLVSIGGCATPDAAPAADESTSEVAEPEPVAPELPVQPQEAELPEGTTEQVQFEAPQDPPHNPTPTTESTSRNPLAIGGPGVGEGILQQDQLSDTDRRRNRTHRPAGDPGNDPLAGLEGL